MADYFNISEIEFETGYIPYPERPETYIVPVIFSLILIIGVTGNGFLILILLCDAAMRNIPNTYVFSLAMGDLLVSIRLPLFLEIFSNLRREFKNEVNIHLNIREIYI